jgi:hypothetical protein
MINKTINETVVVELAAGVKLKTALAAAAAAVMQYNPDNGRKATIVVSISGTETDA